MDLEAHGPGKRSLLENGWGSASECVMNQGGKAADSGIGYEHSFGERVTGRRKTSGVAQGSLVVGGGVTSKYCLGGET